MDRTLYVALTVLLVVAQASLLWRLFRVGVAREYSFFVALIVWVLAASGGLWVVLQVEGNGLIYGKAWLTNEFLICAAALCALLEIFNILLADFRGFQGLGQQLIRGCLVVSGVMVALLWVPFDGCLVVSGVMVALLWVPFDGLGSWRGFSTFEGRTAYLSLALTAACFGLFGAYFRLRASLNTQLIYAALAGMLVGRGAYYTLRLYLPQDWNWSILVSTACWELLWVALAVALVS